MAGKWAGEAPPFCERLCPAVRRRARLLCRLARRPQHHRRALLIGHALRVADQLHLQTPGREKVSDALARRRSLLHREWTEEGLHALAVEIVFRRLEVVDIEGDVIAADIA